MEIPWRIASLRSDILQPQWEWDLRWRNTCIGRSFASEPDSSEAEVSPAIYLLPVCMVYNGTPYSGLPELPAWQLSGWTCLVPTTCLFKLPPDFRTLQYSVKWTGFLVLPVPDLCKIYLIMWTLVYRFRKLSITAAGLKDQASYLHCCL